MLHSVYDDIVMFWSDIPENFTENAVHWPYKNIFPILIHPFRSSKNSPPLPPPNPNFKEDSLFPLKVILLSSVERKRINLQIKRPKVKRSALKIPRLVLY